MVDNYGAFFNCTPVDRASDSMMPRHKAIHFSWLGLSLLSGSPGRSWCISIALGFSKLFGAQGLQSSGSLLNMLSPR